MHFTLMHTRIIDVYAHTIVPRYTHTRTHIVVIIYTLIYRTTGSGGTAEGYSRPDLDLQSLLRPADISRERH